MRISASQKLGAYAVLAALGLLAALATGLSELVALAAPFALVLALGLGRSSSPSLRATLTLDRDRVLQGDSVAATLELESSARIGALELFVRLPAGLRADGNPAAVSLAAGERRSLRLPLRCERWGAYLPGEVFVRARDRLGLLVFEARLDRRTPLKVYPRPEELRSLVRPARTQALAGNEVTRLKGDGIEFADVRPFVAGDQVRRVNWRASARRSELWVNEAHPERNADVVLFLDTFAEARYGAAGTLDLAVRAAGSLAERYLRRHDRVGLVSFGGVLRWLTPSVGLAQLYRIVDALLDTDVAVSYAWKGVEVIPPRTLPPQALVLALTPLLDERTASALLELRGRGFDVAVVDVSPLSFVPPGTDELERLARRLWALRRDVLRGRYRERGIPIAEWREDESLASAIEEVSSFRRRARPVRV